MQIGPSADSFSHAMVEERKATLKRVKRLLDKTSTSDLLSFEASLRNRGVGIEASRMKKDEAGSSQ